MAKKIRNAQVGRLAHTTIPAEYVEEAAIVPSPTAVAAEALATGVVPREAQHRHPEDREIPGEDDLLRAGDPDSRVTDNELPRTSSEILARRDQARGYLDESPDPDPETRRR